MAVIIQIRNDSALNWGNYNPILARGELGIENDTKKFKIGDGVTAWNSLDYFKSGNVESVNGKTGVVTLDYSDVGALPNTTTINDLTNQEQQDALNSGATAAKIAQITTNTNNISTINGLIPNDASTNNQLADKAFVNSSVATNTANFIGTFNSVEELEEYSGTLTNNDYAFVISEDSAGNTVYDRYKYTTATDPAGWIFEYELNNSSFTADLWAAINSKATEEKITQITTNKNAIGTLSSLTTTDKTNLVGAINEVKTAADGKVSEVKINNTSIVSGGVATIPLATDNVIGAAKFGSGLSVSSGLVSVSAATTSQIDTKTNSNNPIVPSNLDYAIKAGITTNTQTLTSAEKADARSWIGAISSSDIPVQDVQINSTSILSSGVANVPIAGSGTLGVVKLNANQGVSAYSAGDLVIISANENEIIAKTNAYKPIVPNKLDVAVREGLGNNSLTWTETYKANARNTIGASEQTEFVDWE